MKNNFKSYIYRIEYYKTLQFQNMLFPICYFFDGSVSHSLVAFCKMQMDVGSGSLRDLARICRIVARIYHFYHSQKDTNSQWKSNPNQIFLDYFSARLHGTVGLDGDNSNLFYKSISYNYAKSEINDFNRYHKWCRRYLNVTSSDDYIGELTKRYGNVQKNSKFSLLAHLNMDHSLFCDKKESWITSQREQFRSDPYNPSNYKAFPHYKLLDFINLQMNPNFKAAFLLQAFTGLRGSEVLHIMITDIVPNIYGGYEVIVSHPFNGNTFDPMSKELINREFLLKTFASSFKKKVGLSEEDISFLDNLKPRVNIIGKYNLEWKGMKFPNVDNNNSPYGYTLDWINDFAKKEFERLIPELRKQFRRNHPYLFVTRKTGMPLTIANYTNTFRVKSKSILGYCVGPHSLRHFCGEYCANGINFNLEQTRDILRHHQLSSTEKYFRKTKKKIRSELQRANGLDNGVDEDWSSTLKQIADIWS